MSGRKEQPVSDRTARPADLFEVAIGRLDRATGLALVDPQAPERLQHPKLVVEAALES